MRFATPLLVAFLFVSAGARAQTPGSCTLGTATGRLDVSDVEAGLYNTGALFFGGGEAWQYALPRATGRTPIYAAELWVGGRIGGEVRFAGGVFGDHQYWPGPLGLDGRPVNPADCSAYDRIWVVSTDDIAAYEAGGAPTADLAQWPIGLGAGAVDAAGDPIVTTDLTRVIDLAAGERPVVYGSQTAFWVMNDAGNVRTGATGNPIGLEVRVHAFAVASSDLALARATFYRYTLVNRNTAPLTDAYFSLFMDPELGHAGDDYLHTDTTRGMFANYNADEVDDDRVGYGSPLGVFTAYGPQPPALGIDLLDGAGASSTWISGGPAGTQVPHATPEFYNFQQGLWGDGVPVREGGSGRNQDGPVTTFMFPGDPVIGQFWSGENDGNGPSTPGDRRMALTSPSFALQPGEARTFDVALLFGRGGSRLGSVTALRAVSDQVQVLHDTDALFAPAPAYTPVTPGTAALLAPAEGAVLGDVGHVLLDWSPVAGATDYVVETSADPSFVTLLTSSLVTVDSMRFVPRPNVAQAVYWRVRAYAQWAEGAVSEARSFTARGPYRPGFSAVEEWDAAGPIAVEADGQPTDPSLLNSLNSTATRPPGYVVGGGNAQANNPESILAAIDRDGVNSAVVPHDYEIRWVEPAQGSAVFNFATGAFLTCYETGTLATDGAVVTDVARVAAPVVNGLPLLPFQVWEVRDDGTERRTVALVNDEDSDGCYGFTASGGTPLSRTAYERMYGYERAYVEADLIANPRGVYDDPGHEAFARVQVVPVAAGPARPPQAGTRIRLDRVEPYGPGVASEAPPSPVAGLSVGAARPNPVRGRATLQLTAPTAGRARVALYDVLGREVAVLLDADVAAGTTTVALNGSRLAAGVYVVVVESGGARAARVVTVGR